MQRTIKQIEIEGVTIPVGAEVMSRAMHGGAEEFEFLINDCVTVTADLCFDDEAEYFEEVQEQERYQLKINDNVMYTGDLVGCWLEIEILYDAETAREFEERSTSINMDVLGYIKKDKIVITCLG